MTTTFFGPPPLQDTFFIPGGNTVGSGVQLFFYAAGSSTKQTVFKDSSGSTAHTNPIVLDSGGNLPSGGVIWFTSGVAYKAVYAPANDTDPPQSPYRTIDNLSGINDVTASAAGAEWTAGPTPTFIGATTFALAGDQTSVFTAGRRIKTTNSGGTVYSTIVSSGYSSSTTIAALNDSGTFDSGLSAVSYGLLSSVNPSIPNAYHSTFTAALTGCTASVTSTAYYSVNNGWVSLFISSLSGTSSSTATSITGVPALIQPLTARVGYAYAYSDNGSTGAAPGRADLSGSVITLYTSSWNNSTAWTSSGSKAIGQFVINYPLQP